MATELYDTTSMFKAAEMAFNTGFAYGIEWGLENSSDMTEAREAAKRAWLDYRALVEELR